MQPKLYISRTPFWNLSHMVPSHASIPMSDIWRMWRKALWYILHLSIICNIVLSLSSYAYNYAGEYLICLTQQPQTELSTYDVYVYDHMTFPCTSFKCLSLTVIELCCRQDIQGAYRSNHLCIYSMCPEVQGIEGIKLGTRNILCLLSS